MYKRFYMSAVEDFDGECTIKEKITTQKELDKANKKRISGQHFFWSVYGVDKNNLSECISDFKNIKKAKMFLSFFNKAIEKKTVKVEVYGGVAEVTECPDDVSVKIIDHDN